MASPNMHYCAIQNTYEALMQVDEILATDELSESERMYRDKLLALCQELVDNYYTG